MSSAGILYVVGSFAIFLAERMFSANDMVRWPLLLLGVVLVGSALAGRATSWKRNPKATKMSLGLFGISMLSGLCYIASMRESVALLGLTQEKAEHLRIALEALIPLVWLTGALPALAIDATLSASPHSVHPGRLRNALEGGLAVAFGIGMLFPINYLATEHNKRFDYGFFKTTAVGSSTIAAVESMTEPMRVVLFFPPSSEVLREVRPYFDDLAGSNLQVEVMDQTMDPEQAKAWKVRDNGTIVFVKGQGESEQTESLKLDDDLDKARKDLRKLDSKVQTALLKLARDKRTVYFTVGHEELYWKGAADEFSNVDMAKKILEGLNLKVKELGVDDGLAQAVPDDAAVVFVVGPRRAFLPEEIKALQDYRQRGGALFINLEPASGPDDVADPALAALAGVGFGDQPLMSDKAFLKVTGGPSDRAFVGTNKYSSHESITTLSKNAQQATFITPGVGSIAELQDHAGKVTNTIKAMPEWWADTNGNFQFDKDPTPAADGTISMVGEKRGGLEIASVASGPADSNKEWRAAVIGDATWMSNAILKNQANAVYLVSTVGWLTQDPALTGETETEEDIKIQHTKEGEAMWFYGSSALVPAVVFLLGMLRVRSRKVKGNAS